METLLTDRDMKQLSYPEPVRIMTNDEIDNMECIHDLFLTSDVVYLLYPWADGGVIGHWCCITKSNETYVFFDSYGKFIDKHATKKIKRNITRLFLTAPRHAKLQYNSIRLQDLDPDVATCGRWCVLWAREKNKYKEVDLFGKDIIKYSRKSLLTPDELVVLLTQKKKSSINIRMPKKNVKRGGVGSNRRRLTPADLSRAVKGPCLALQTVVEVPVDYEDSKGNKKKGRTVKPRKILRVKKEKKGGIGNTYKPSASQLRNAKKGPKLDLKKTVTADVNYIDSKGNKRKGKTTKLADALTLQKALKEGYKGTQGTVKKSAEELANISKFGFDETAKTIVNATKKIEEGLENVDAKTSKELGSMMTGIITALQQNVNELKQDIKEDARKLVSTMAENWGDDEYEDFMKDITRTYLNGYDDASLDDLLRNGSAQDPRYSNVALLYLALGENLTGRNKKTIPQMRKKIKELLGR